MMTSKKSYEESIEKLKKLFPSNEKAIAILNALENEIKSEQWIKQVNINPDSPYTDEYYSNCLKYIYNNIQTTDQTDITDFKTYLDTLSKNQIISMAHKLYYMNVNKKQSISEDIDWLDKKYQISF